MNFKRQYDYSSAGSVSKESLVKCIVSDASQETQGQVEALSEQVQTLTEIVGWMAQKLQKDDFIEMAYQFGFEFCGEDREGAKK